MKDKNRIFWELPIPVENSAKILLDFTEVTGILHSLRYKNLDYIAFVSKDGKRTKRIFIKGFSNDEDLINVLFDNYVQYEGGSIQIVKGGGEE